MMNVLFICHMLWARDVSNIEEYKPSIVTGGLNENNVYPEESIANYKEFKCGRLLSAKKFNEVGCQSVSRNKD